MACAEGVQGCVKVASWLQYISFLLKEKKNIEDRLEKMSKAEMVALNRQLIGACQQSLKGFDAWFTDYYIMEKMDAEMVRDITKSLLRIGFDLLEYDRDITKLWYDMELNDLQKKMEAEAKKRNEGLLI
jgi:hypothetical protein